MRYLNRYFALLAMLAACILLLTSCTENNEDTHALYTISSDDPEIGFWVMLQASENIAEGDAPYTVDISFGTRAHNLERYEITTVSEDFDIEKSCGDMIIVDGEKYTDEDFYVTSMNVTSSLDLPQEFTLLLTKKDERELYAGEVDVIITEYLTGGYSTGSVTLYYYGNDHRICFSVVSQQEAKIRFNSQLN